MKKILSIISIILIIVCLIFVLFIKDTDKEDFIQLDKEGSIAIVYPNKLGIYSIKEDRFVKQMNFPLTISEETNFDFAPIGKELLFSTGYPSSKKSMFKIGRINMETGEYKENIRAAFPTTGEGYDDKFFYTMTSEVGNGTLIHQINAKGEEVNKAILEKESLGRKIIGAKNQVLMLAGIEDLEMSETFYSTRLFFYDKDTMDTQGSYQFDELSDDYLLGLTDMELINETLYLPITAKRNRVNPGEDMLSSEILSFDLKTKEKRFIQLDENYPTGIKKDKNEQRLLIFHEPNMLKKWIISIYNLENHEVITINIQELLHEPQEEITRWRAETTRDNKLIIYTGKYMMLYDMKKKILVDTIELEDVEQNMGLYIYSYG